VLLTCANTTPKVRQSPRITAKPGDVPLHPSEPQLLVVQPVVRLIARLPHRGRSQEPERTESVTFTLFVSNQCLFYPVSRKKGAYSLDPDSHNGTPALDAELHQPRELPLRPVGAARHEAAAVDVHQHRKGPPAPTAGLGADGSVRCRHVQGQAFQVAELVLRVGKGVLQEELLEVAVLGVCDGEGTVEGLGLELDGREETTAKGGWRTNP